MPRCPPVLELVAKISRGTRKTKAASGTTSISLTGDAPSRWHIEIGDPDLMSANIVGGASMPHRSLIIDWLKAFIARSPVSNRALTVILCASRHWTVTHPGG